MIRPKRASLAPVVLALSSIGALAGFRPGAVGTPARLGTVAGELADPAAVPVAGGRIQVYATNTELHGWKHVPTWTADPDEPASMAGVTDALPVLPPWVRHNPVDPFPQPIVWAPTVRYVAGRYLMMYTGGRAEGAACLNAATAVAPAGPFQPVALGPSGAWCDPSSAGTGWLDPQLFVVDGSVHLYWSVQPGDGTSTVVGQRLSRDGLTRVGSAVALATFDQVRQVGGPNGGHPQIENPAMIADGFGYHLAVSVGTYSQTGYRTVGLACASPLGPCGAPEPLDIGARPPTSLSYARDQLPARAVYGWRVPSVTAPRSVWTVAMAPVCRPVTGTAAPASACDLPVGAAPDPPV